MASIDSPFEKFPGHVVVPDYLTAHQVNEWLKRGRNMPEALQEADPRFVEFYTRAHLVEMHLQKLGADGKLEPLVIDPAGLDYPAAIAAWIVDETSDLVLEAVNKKN